MVTDFEFEATVSDGIASDTAMVIINYNPPPTEVEFDGVEGTVQIANDLMFEGDIFEIDVDLNQLQPGTNVIGHLPAHGPDGTWLQWSMNPDNRFSIDETTGDLLFEDLATVGETNEFFAYVVDAYSMTPTPPEMSDEAWVSVTIGQPLVSIIHLGYSDEIDPELPSETTLIEGQVAEFAALLAEPLTYNYTFNVQTIDQSNGDTNENGDPEDYADAWDDYTPIDIQVTIPAGEVAVHFFVDILYDFDSEGIIDVDEATETLTIEAFGIDEESLGNGSFDIEDDIAISEYQGTYYLAKRTGTRDPDRDPFVGDYDGGWNGYWGGGGWGFFGGDQIRWKVDQSSPVLPINGELIYFDDWTPGLVLLGNSSHSWNPFKNDYHGAGKRRGSVMIHDSEKYYFVDLLEAARTDAVDSKDEWEEFLEGAKKRYTIDTKLRELRAKLRKNLDEVNARKLHKALDDYYFKAGTGNIVDGLMEARDDFEQILTDIEEGAAHIEAILSQIPAYLLDEYGVLIHNLKIIHDTSLPSTKTLAIEFIEASKVLIVTKSANGQTMQAKLVEKETFINWNYEVEYDNIDFETGGNPSLNGFTFTADLLNKIGEASDWMSRIDGVLEMLDGLDSEDSVENLKIVQGILTIGGTLGGGVPGVSHMLGYYHDMVGIAIGGLKDLKYLMVLNNINNAINHLPFTADSFSDFTSGLQGGHDASVIMSPKWMYNHGFEEHFPQFD